MGQRAPEINHNSEGGLSALPMAPGVRLRTVSTDRPWAWLAAAWDDLRAAPVVSLGYGGLAVVSIYLLIWGLMAQGLHYLILPMAAGFMLVGPVFAAGLYETSRRREQGMRPTLYGSLGGFTRNTGQIVAVGFVLMLALLAWIRIAFLIFALFFSMDPPAFDLLFDKIFHSEHTIPFLLTGTIIGGMIAAAVFALSAISIPMLLDRDAHVMEALGTSVAATLHNWRTMAVWSGLIALFIGAGMVTAFLGLVVAFPLIGYATWHAYRDLIT